MQRIVNGVLQNEEEIAIPWSMGWLNQMLKSFLPAPIMDRVLKVVVGWDAMA